MLITDLLAVKEDTLTDMVNCMTDNVGLVHQMPYTCDGTGLSATLEKVCHRLSTTDQVYCTIFFSLLSYFIMLCFDGLTRHFNVGLFWDLSRKKLSYLGLCGYQLCHRHVIPNTLTTVLLIFWIIFRYVSSHEERSPG